METIEVAVKVVPWLTMDNGRRLYAHVIGLRHFVVPSHDEEETNQSSRLKQ